MYSLDYAGGDATLLASGGADETVRLWDVTTGSGSVVAGGGGTAGGGDEETCRRGQDVEDEIDPRVRGEVYAT